MAICGDAGKGFRDAVEKNMQVQTLRKIRHIEYGTGTRSLSLAQAPTIIAHLLLFVNSKFSRKKYTKTVFFQQFLCIFTNFFIFFEQFGQKGEEVTPLFALLYYFSVISTPVTAKNDFFLMIFF